MNASHRSPTFYFVGPAISPIDREPYGYICAECPEGRGKPRYLLFSTLFEANVHLDYLTRRDSARGISWESGHGPLPQDEASIGAQWARMGELMPDSLSRADSAFFRSVVQQPRTRRRKVVAA